MTVALGQGGFAGWRLLQRTQALQQERVARDPQVARASAHFAEAKDKYDSAEEIVGDREVLKVALTAFGLEGDLPNKAFIRKILESDLRDPKSLVNRLTDKRYLKFAQAFGLGPNGQRPAPETVANRIGQLYIEKEFQRQVGEVDPNLRLALNARSELNLLANRTSTERAKWFEVLGNLPLRSVMEGALGLPTNVQKAPIDRQLEMFQDAAARRFGADFFGQLKDDPAALGKLIDSFVARSSIGAAANTPYSAALAILSA